MLLSAADSNFGASNCAQTKLNLKVVLRCCIHYMWTLYVYSHLFTVFIWQIHMSRDILDCLIVITFLYWITFQIILVLCALKGEKTLSLLVENCGRVNYGKALDDQRKGIFCLQTCLVLCSTLVYCVHQFLRTPEFMTSHCALLIILLLYGIIFQTWT